MLITKTAFEEPLEVPRLLHHMETTTYSTIWTDNYNLLFSTLGILMTLTGSRS
jgi:hypothetical protein